MNIYLVELKHQWKSFTLWTLGIFGYMIAAMSKYQGYSRSGESINDLIDDLPAGFSSFLGADVLDLQSASGFFAISILYIGVMLGVQAVLLGSNIIAKEETEKTIEFLAVKPVSRNHILFAKLLAAITVIVGLNLTALVSSLITVNMFNDGPSINRDIFFLMPAVFFIQLIFLMVGVSFATIMRRSKRAGLLSAAVLLASFIISVYVDVSDRFEFLRYLTPFQYFDPKVIIGEGAYDWVYILIAAAAVILMTAASRLAYMRRDFSV